MEFRYAGTSEKYEIVRWSPNPFYGHEDEYDYFKERDCYCKKGNNHSFIHASCFKNPESCLLMASFDVRNDGESVDLTFCGSRPMSLSDDEFADFKKLAAYGYKKLSKYGEFDTV